jgi:hypothetical protein
MARARPDRTGWLGPIRVVLIFAFVGDLLFLLPALFNHGPIEIGTVPATVFGTDTVAHRTHPEMSTPGWIQVEMDGSPLVEPHYDTVDRLLYLTANGLAFSLASAIMIILAFRLIGEAMATDPFTRSMIHRLRSLGAVVLVGGALSEAAQVAAAYLLFRRRMPKEWLPAASPNIPVSLWWLLPGLILLVVAEIVRRGYLMRAELDTVI